VDGSVVLRYIRIDVRDSGSGDSATSKIPKDRGINFDEGARNTKDGNDFIWSWDKDRPIFRKWDDDEGIQLASLDTGSTKEFNNLSEDSCRWNLDRADRFHITIELGGMACFRTDEGNIGKLRFKGGNPDEVEIQWRTWD
jgi:hypothetical protein